MPCNVEYGEKWIENSYGVLITRWLKMVEQVSLAAKCDAF